MAPQDLGVDRERVAPAARVLPERRRRLVQLQVLGVAVQFPAHINASIQTGGPAPRVLEVALLRAQPGRDVAELGFEDAVQAYH